MTTPDADAARSRSGLSPRARNEQRRQRRIDRWTIAAYVVLFAMLGIPLLVGLIRNPVEAIANVTMLMLVVLLIVLVVALLRWLWRNPLAALAALLFWWGGS